MPNVSFTRADDIEIGQAGLDHDHVGAFLDIERDLAQGLVGVGGVHLIGALVAGQRLCRSDGVAERPVKGRGIFRRIGHDRHVGEVRRVERLADCADASVHHVGWRDDVAAGFRLHQCLLHQHGDRFIIDDDAVAQKSIVAMAGEGIERDVAQNADVRHFFLDGANGAADEIVGIERFAAGVVAQARVGVGKQRDAGDSQLGGRFGLANDA